MIKYFGNLKIKSLELVVTKGLGGLWKIFTVQAVLWQTGKARTAQLGSHT